MVKKIKKEEKVVENKNTEKLLFENYLELQKVLTTLAVNIDSLSKRIDKLVGLFEQSVKTIAEKDFQEETKNRQVQDKLEMLINQNKIIAQGVSLIHEGVPETPSGMNQYMPEPNQIIQRTMERPSPQSPSGYQKSITEQPQRFNPLPTRP